MTFKEYYVSRADMWNFRTCLIDSCVYVGKIESWLGILCTVSDVSDFQPSPSQVFSDLGQGRTYLVWICIRRNQSCLSIIQLPSFGLHSTGERGEMDEGEMCACVFRCGILISEEISISRNVIEVFCQSCLKGGQVSRVLITCR